MRAIVTQQCGFRGWFRGTLVAVACTLVSMVLWVTAHTPSCFAAGEWVAGVAVPRYMPRGMAWGTSSRWSAYRPFPVSPSGISSMRRSGLKEPWSYLVPFWEYVGLPKLGMTLLQLLVIAGISSRWPRRATEAERAHSVRFRDSLVVGAICLIPFPALHHVLLVFWDAVDSAHLRVDSMRGHAVSLYLIGAFGLMLVNPVGHFAATRLALSRFVEAKFDNDEGGYPTCHSCGYRPGEIAAARCPECGRDLAQSAQRARHARSISAVSWVFLVVVLACFPLLWALWGLVLPAEWLDKHFVF